MNSEITNKTESNSENPFLTAQYRVSVFSDGSIKIEPTPLEAILQDKNNQPLANGQRDRIGTVTVQPDITFRTADAKPTTLKQLQCSARIMQILKVLSFAELLHTDYPKLDASIILNRSVRRCADELNIAIASVNDKLGRQMGRMKLSNWSTMLQKLFDAPDNNNTDAKENKKSVEDVKNKIKKLLRDHIGKGSEEKDQDAIEEFFEIFFNPSITDVEKKYSDFFQTI